MYSTYVRTHVKAKGRRLTPTAQDEHSDLPYTPDLAYVEVASTELTREVNRDVILRLIRSLQPISRVELARVSGLRNSTVSSLVEQLLQERWILEREAVKTARGRRPIQITLNDRLSILAADVHPGRANVAAIDLNGQILASSVVEMPADVEESIGALTSALTALRAQFQDRPFEGAGVCLPGRVDTESARVMIAPNLRWREYDVRETLQKALGMQVELENDANGCLLAELWFGRLTDVRNAVLLAISEGVGASLLANGHLFEGRSGMAGEFGHLCIDPAGPLCGCGRRGCWEVFASTSATLARYSQGKKAKKIDYPELCRRAMAGDAAAREALEKQASIVGKGLRMVTAALAPEMILFSGDFALSWPIALPILLAACQSNLLGGTCPRLTCTGELGQAYLLGAAAVVLQRHTGYYRSRSLEAINKLNV